MRIYHKHGMLNDTFVVFREPENRRTFATSKVIREIKLLCKLSRKENKQ